MSGFSSWLVVGAGILLAIYFSRSPPSFSQGVDNWRKKGLHYTHQGHKIFYIAEKGSKSDGSVVVCLHGFPSFSYDWHKIWPILQSEFSQVIALDFLGFGLSDKPPSHPYSLLEQSDIVEGLLRQLGVHRVHLLAHDYGDTVAQELLARFNECFKSKSPCLQLESVVLLNGGIFPETNFPRMSQKLLLIPYLNEVFSRIGNYYTFKISFGEVFGPHTQPSTEEFGDFWAAVNYNHGNIVLPKLLCYIAERKEHRDRWVGALQQAKTPVHVIYGPADPVNPPGFVDYYKDLVADSSVTVLSAHISHYPQLEDAAATRSAYTRFVRTVKEKTSNE